MALFGFGKKKEQEKVEVQGSESCCCSEEANAAGPSVKVLGSGCAKCNSLEAATVEALAELGMDTSIEHVTDFAEIAAYGVMTTPALVVDGKVVSSGKVLKKKDVVKILEKVR